MTFVVAENPFASNSREFIDEFKAKLNSEFRVKLLQKLANFIGSELAYTNIGIYVIHSMHVEKILKNDRTCPFCHRTNFAFCRHIINSSALTIIID